MQATVDHNQASSRLNARSMDEDDAVNSAKSMPANRIPRFVGHGAEECIKQCN